MSETEKHTPDAESHGSAMRDRLCKATTKAGTPCRFPAQTDGSGFCWNHNPATSKERAAARRKGGTRATDKRRALLGQIDFGSAEGVRTFLEGLCAATITEAVSAGRAQAAAQIAQAALAVRAGQELGERLDALEVSIRQVVEEAGQGGAV